MLHCVHCDGTVVLMEHRETAQQTGLVDMPMCRQCAVEYMTRLKIIDRKYHTLMQLRIIIHEDAIGKREAAIELPRGKTVAHRHVRRIVHRV